jgi:predicted aspartyl protease
MIVKSLLVGFLFNILLSLPLHAQVPGFYMKERAKKTELPFYSSNNLIILPVSINGGTPVNFLIDTGVKTNILFSKTIGDQLNMTYTRNLDLVGADGKTVLTANVSPTNHLDLASWRVFPRQFLFWTTIFFELEMVIGVPVFGVIGYEFFKYNPVKIDYDKSLITFYESDRLKWRPFGFRKIQIEIDNGKPYIKGRVKQISSEELSAKLLIDLGANHGLLLNMETSDKITLPPKHIESDLGRSLGGELFGYVGRVRSLKLDGLNFIDVITSYPEETEFSYVIKESGRQGSLGSELWGQNQNRSGLSKKKALLEKGIDFFKSI